MKAQTYPSDTTKSQWEHIKDEFVAHRRGRPREVDLQAVVNAILYMTMTGCQWRYLPKEYPPWQNVYYYFGKWQGDGTWQRIHERLRCHVRHKAGRHKAGRHKHPTAGCLDSQSVNQSVKTTCVPGERGYDAAKKVVGRKRHLLVDTMGLLLCVVVTAACVSESAGCFRKRRSAFGVEPDAGWVQETAKGVGGRRVFWNAAGMGALAVAPDLGSGQAPARAKRLCCFAAPLGRRTHLCLALVSSSAVQRL